MARSARQDPVRNFKFIVDIIPGGKPLGKVLSDNGGRTQVGFAVVSGLSVNNEMVGYREGGMNTHPWKFVGQSDFAPVTFSRGVFRDNRYGMYAWQNFLHSYNSAYAGDPIGTTSGTFTQGSRPTSTATTRDNNHYRADIVITVLDHPASDWKYATPGKRYTTQLDTNKKFEKPVAVIKMFECWPGSFSFSDFNAGDSGIMIQQMTLHHEGFVIGWDLEEMQELSGRDYAEVPAPS